MKSKLWLYCLPVVFFCSYAEAESVRLRSGETFIGKVTSASFQEVKISTIYPEEKSLTFESSKIHPGSLYELLSIRLDPKDASERLRLANYCFKHELFNYGLAELNRVERLDFKLSKTVRELRRKAENALGQRLLDEALIYLAVDKTTRARLYLQSILKNYPKSKASRKAKELLGTLTRKAKRKKKSPVSSKRGKEEILRKLKKAKDLFDIVEKKTQSLNRHFTMGRKDELLLRRARGSYTKVYKMMGEASRRSTDDGLLDKELKNLATLSRSRLTKTYLELGGLYLQRGAIQAAEQCCVRACELEPENKDLHHLHKRILQARLAQRFGGY